MGGNGSKAVQQSSASREQAASVADLMSSRQGHPGCRHVQAVSKQRFRELVRRKFLGEVNGAIPRSAQTAPEVTSKSPASVIANAGAPSTGKDELVRTQTILHCQACASQGDGFSDEAKKHVRDLVTASRFGAICNLEHWMCMECGFMACLSPYDKKQHLLAHYHKTKHPLWIQCHDSHVFCVTCQLYVYPRELSGSSRYERILDDVVYQWLLTLGRVRLWWRVMDESLPKQLKENAGRGGDLLVRGIENFGNTCFFTSTCQALNHCKAFRERLAKSDDDGRPIQRELARLLSTYWDPSSKKRNINPRPFFRAVAENALFGRYSDHTMEDANSLIVDILNGMDPQLVNSTFGVRLQSRITCKRCEEAEKQRAKAADGETNSSPKEKGGAPRPLPMETVLSLGLTEQSYEGADVKKNIGKEETEGVLDKLDQKTRRIVELMTIHTRAQHASSVDVSDLVERYFQKEHIPDYRCSGCKLKGECFKEVNPTRLPKVLILQLKRFAPISLGVQIKSHRKVNVTETLNLKPFHLASDEKVADSHAYKLSSMVVHDGGMGGGHNMCYVRLPPSEGGDKWMWFSDRHIGPVPKAEVEAAEPYILFYTMEEKADTDSGQ